MELYITTNHFSVASRVRGLGSKRCQLISRRQPRGLRCPSLSSGFKSPSRRLAARRSDVDLADRSREMFENLLERSSIYSKRALEYWEDSEEKLTFVSIALIACVFLYALNSMLGALEDVLLVGSLLKIIGLYVSGYTIFRLISYEADRQEASAIINTFLEKVVGNDK